jgi:hypothetical protein
VRENVISALDVIQNVSTLPQDGSPSTVPSLSSSLVNSLKKSSRPKINTFIPANTANSSNYYQPSSISSSSSSFTASFHPQPSERVTKLKLVPPNISLYSNVSKEIRDKTTSMNNLLYTPTSSSESSLSLSLPYGNESSLLSGVNPSKFSRPTTPPPSVHKLKSLSDIGTPQKVPQSPSNMLVRLKEQIVFADPNVISKTENITDKRSSSQPPRKLPKIPSSSTYKNVEETLSQDKSLGIVSSLLLNDKLKKVIQSKNVLNLSVFLFFFFFSFICFCIILSFIT